MPLGPSPRSVCPELLSVHDPGSEEILMGVKRTERGGTALCSGTTVANHVPPFAARQCHHHAPKRPITPYSHISSGPRAATEGSQLVIPDTKLDHC
jgi:hypothetical protein